MNGWQTYASWNDLPSIGLSTNYRPNEWLGFVANFYYGADTRDEAGRMRFHSDHSALVRYFDAPKSQRISKAAFSVNNHIGFEWGGPSTTADGRFLGTSVAHRVWFDRDAFAITLRAEAVTNPTRYLAIPPTHAGFADGGSSLRLGGLAATLDILPTDFFTWRFEFLARRASVPYFAGKDGTTSPDGFQGTAGPFTPDLSRTQRLLTAALNFRL